MLFTRLLAVAQQIYITQECANVLRLRQPQYAIAILETTATLRKGRYLRRWSRRLRSFAFSREDACVIAYGSFGVDAHSEIPNIEALITNDVRLVTNFEYQYARIKDRFVRMVVNLPDPYLKIKLPVVISTHTALGRF